MASKYRVHHSPMPSERQGRAKFAVAIVDHGTSEQLGEAIEWYRANLNHNLFVVTGGDAPIDEYDDVNFIVFTTWATLGEKINAVANECMANYFLITRSDLYLVRFDGQRLFAKGTSRIAWASVVANSHKEIVPSLRIPHMEGDRIEADSDFPLLDEERGGRTLYPLLGLGLYDRAVFQRLRGFDEHIESSYYQLLDWGLRAALMGHRVISTSALLMQFIERESVIEDRSEKRGYLRCYTKALSYKKKRDGTIELKKPKRAFFDRSVWKDEVKPRLRWQVKEDFPSLVASWKQEEEQ